MREGRVGLASQHIRTHWKSVSRIAFYPVPERLYGRGVNGSCHVLLGHRNRILSDDCLSGGRVRCDMMWCD